MTAEIIQKIKNSWTIDTTFCNEDYRNPAWGQCAVTSCLVQDLIGGRIIRAFVKYKDTDGFHKYTSHYFNQVEGKYIDLTWEQFPPHSIAYGMDEKPRDYLLRNEWFMQRYQQLVNNFNSQQ